MSMTISNPITQKMCYGTALFLFILGVVATEADAQTTDRSTPPLLGPPPVLRLAPVQHAQLSNGLRVTVMEKRGVPLVEVRLMVHAGLVDEPGTRHGIASMTAAMMTEGAGTRNSLELADAIDFLGAHIGVSAGLHNTTASLFTPLSKFDEALSLFRDIALRPLFPAEELDRLRKERLTAMKQWHDQPRSIASIGFPKLLFGETNDYGRPSTGDEASLVRMTADDIRSYYTAHFHAGNAQLIVSGDVTLSSITSKLEAAFGTWAAGRITPFKEAPAAQVQHRMVYLIDKPGAAQSEIRIGRIGVKRTDPDYAALVVMNTILGGSFSSRLNQNLREKNGYTYGASSSFAFRPVPGPFMAGAAVQTAVTDKALAEFMNELNSIMQPVTDEELTRAKNYVAYGYPQNFQTVSEIASELEELVEYQLPDDYFSTFTSKILSISKEDVLRVATAHLDPNKIIIVVVGDRSQIEEGIRALKLGEVKLLSISDVLGKVPR
jgi:predicted Zn-dependent peptidase